MAIFVDLHRVVRQALRVGVPKYSLKEVQALAGFHNALCRFVEMAEPPER